MSNQSFEQAMNQIGRAAESQQQREFLAQRRRQIFDRIRRVCFVLFSAGAIAAGIYYHENVQTFLSEKLGMGVGPKISSETSESLKQFQEHAAKRDKVLDAIEK